MPESIRCNNCGGENPESNRFCGNCGSALVATGPAEPERSGQLEERRIATVLFADLSGFTELSGRTDPEDVRELVDTSMALIGDIIDRYGGHVDKVIGDAVMALWGVPKADEDHAERAVRAALEMLECARTHQKEFGGLPLRIGVNTGELMFAPVGPRSRREQTVMGDVVNIASRLQNAAPRDAILVGEETWRETRRAIRYEQVEPFEVKGKDEPIDGWLAKEPVADVPTERPLSLVPMVGRAQELGFLREAWNAALEGAGTQFVVVVGAPGVGKSRLCQEFGDQCRSTGALVVRSRSLPYGDAAGYGAFAETVRHATGVSETDKPSAARDKVADHLRDAIDESRRGDIAASLATMAGFGSSEAKSRAGLFDAATEWVEGLASTRPLLLIFEDMHWSDTSLVDLVEHLVTAVRHSPVLILATARPELLDNRPSLGARVAGFKTLHLDSLAPSAADELVRQVLRGHRVTPAIFERIRLASGGNPLFIEELATSVAEGTTDPMQALPTNLVSIIAARFDAMPARERQVLLEAAVVGDTFWYNLLTALDAEPGTDEALGWLEDHDYIRREPASDIEGDAAYSFRHVLLREVAYNTLPRAQRRLRHAIVARRAEEQFTEPPRSFTTVLAHHWREAGEPDRAIDYLLQAAEQASRSWAKREAVALYSEAIDLMADDDPRKRSTTLRRAVADQQIRHVEFGDVTTPADIGDISQP